MEITNEQIYEKLKNIEAMLAASIRLKQPAKVQRLENEIKLKGRMNVGQVQSFFGGMSRPWALNRMKKLGEQPYFKFIVGDKNKKTPSLIVYRAEEKVKDYFKKIKEFVDKTGAASFAEIISLLGLNLEEDLSMIRIILRDFIKSGGGENSGYEIIDDNKLHKKDLTNKRLNSQEEPTNAY